jgi:hypothetical protein
MQKSPGTRLLKIKEKRYYADVRISITDQKQVAAFSSLGVYVKLGDVIVMDAKCFGAWSHRVTTDGNDNQVYGPMIDCLKLGRGHQEGTALIVNFHKNCLEIHERDKRPGTPGVFRVACRISFPAPNENYDSKVKGAETMKKAIIQARDAVLDACHDKIRGLGFDHTIFPPDTLPACKNQGACPSRESRGSSCES